MRSIPFPVIDAEETGRKIRQLRQERGLSVRDVQGFFGFEEPRVIYMWQHGQCLPSVDNLYALSVLLNVPINEILVSSGPQVNTENREQQASACCSPIFCAVVQLLGRRRERKTDTTHLLYPAGIPASAPMEQTPQGSGVQLKNSIRFGWRCPHLRAHLVLAMWAGMRGR